jgi:hypothetical protein
MPSHVEGAPFELRVEVLLAILKHIHINVPAAE